MIFNQFDTIVPVGLKKKQTKNKKKRFPGKSTSIHMNKSSEQAPCRKGISRRLHEKR